MSKEAVEAPLDDLFNKYGVPDSERATIRAALQQQEGRRQDQEICKLCGLRTLMPLPTPPEPTA